jgi:holo-[acyl-carrier protein] synthase
MICTMNVIAHGIDMVETRRLAESIDRHGQRFLHRVFTPTEREYCLGRKREIEHLAGRFAAKEAVMKLLGTGWQRGIGWQDIEVVNRPSGQPVVHLHGKCRQLADQMGLARILVSISHVESHAIASVIGSAGPVSPAGESDE